jgi:hypothetical protein
LIKGGTRSRQEMGWNAKMLESQLELVRTFGTYWPYAAKVWHEWPILKRKEIGGLRCLAGLFKVEKAVQDWGVAKVNGTRLHMQQSQLYGQ